MKKCPEQFQPAERAEIDLLREALFHADAELENSIGMKKCPEQFRPAERAEIDLLREALFHADAELEWRKL